MFGSGILIVEFNRKLKLLYISTQRKRPNEKIIAKFEDKK